jgi:hypothetical protein
MKVVGWLHSDNKKIDFGVDEFHDLLTWAFFLCSNWFCFFNFIFQHQIDWELSLVIYFGLFSMRLFLSHELGHEFS